MHIDDSQSRTASIASAVLVGTDALPVTVHAHTEPGSPRFTVAGLSDARPLELRDRLHDGFVSSGLPWRRGRVMVTVGPDHGYPWPGLDLPIAVVLLAAAEELPARLLRHVAAIGEIGRDGSIHPTHCILTRVKATSAAAIIVPDACHADAQLGKGCLVHSARNLRSVVAAFREPWARSEALDARHAAQALFDELRALSGRVRAAGRTDRDSLFDRYHALRLRAVGLQESADWWEALDDSHGCEDGCARVGCYRAASRARAVIEQLGGDE